MTSPERIAELAAERKLYGDRRDCAVWTMAATTGLDYRTCYETFRKLGRRKNCGTPNVLIPKAYAAHGFTFEATPIDRVTVSKLPQVMPDSAAYCVQTSGHQLPVIGKTVHDWTEGRRHRVKRAYRIERIQLKRKEFRPIDGPQLTLI